MVSSILLIAAFAATALSQVTMTVTMFAASQVTNGQIPTAGSGWTNTPTWNTSYEGPFTSAWTSTTSTTSTTSATTSQSTWTAGSWNITASVSSTSVLTTSSWPTSTISQSIDESTAAMLPSTTTVAVAPAITQGSGAALNRVAGTVMALAALGSFFSQL